MNIENVSSGDILVGRRGEMEVIIGMRTRDEKKTYSRDVDEEKAGPKMSSVRNLS